MIDIINILTAIFFLSATTPALSAEPGSDILKIYFLDVGQGDAMILQQSGVCTALVDAGPLIYGHRVTEKLQELGITELDIVIITHPHLDHFGGLFDLHSRVAFKHMYDNGTTNPAVEYFSDYQKLRNKQPYKVLSSGDSITCGDITFKVLYPPGEQKAGQDLNETSLVLMISQNNFRLLQMGDLAGSAEHLFLTDNNNLEADVIKIAHHGAADATSEELLDNVNPRLAIISTSEDNWIDAPSRQVLDRLEKYGINYFRTDQGKTIELVVSKNGQISTVHEP